MSADGAQGASILTSDIPPAPAAAPPPAQGTAAAAVQDVVDGPPEWAPAKYWDPATKSLKTEDLAKGYKNLEQLLGREKVPVPVSEDDEEGWQRWYAASGRPEAPDKYEFKRPEKLPDGIDYDEDTEKEFRQWAHINGLNKKQASALYDGFVKRQIDRQAAYQTHQGQARAQVETDMRREHGQQYEGFVGQAKTAISTYTDPDFRQWLDQTGLGNDPRMIRVFGRIGKELGGATKLKGAAAPEAAPADLDRAIADFRSKNSEALYKKDHPDHEIRVQEYNKLFQMRFPDPS